MLRALSFRKKILLAQGLLFILFLIGVIPLAEKGAALLVRDSLKENTRDLIDLLEKAQTESALIETLNTQSYYSFFRMSIINDQGLVIYDTHLNRLLGAKFQPYPIGEHPEVGEALKKGTGYLVSPSDTFKGLFAYVAERFNFLGKTYILRTAFPYLQIQELTLHFEWAVIIFSFFLLLVFNLLITLIFNRLTKPIGIMIEAIVPYRQGFTDTLAEIKLSSKQSPHDEFQRLAATLNSLSKRIKEQIKALTEERDEKHAILDSLREGVVAVDGSMKVLYVNKIAALLLNTSVDNLLLHPFPFKSSSALEEKCFFLLKKCQRENAFAFDSIVIQEEQKTYLDLIAAPKAHGNGAIIVLQDKTADYRSLEIGKDFVANASHELRTPITIIKGYAETLHDIPNLSKEMVGQITEKIERSCKRMESLIKSLLTLADIDNLSETRFQAVDVIALLESSKQLLLAVHKDIEVSLELSQEKIIIEAEASLLELCIKNLLDNAVKYSQRPAQISIIVQKLETEEVFIQIRDKGMGIPEQDIKRIFERFYRVDKTHSRKLGGAGLGLSIVKTIIDKHKGKISVSSELGKGTSFTLILPLKHPSK